MPASMEWSQVAGVLFFCGWSCIGLYVANTLREMNASFKELTITVAVGMERVSGLERRTEKLEDRVEEL
jgi:uncharacterized protein YoxC